MRLVPFMVNTGLALLTKGHSTALNERREEEFWWYLKLFIVIVCVTAPLEAVELFISSLLALRFRQLLTNMLFDIYMSKRSYYYIRQNMVCFELLIPLILPHVIRDVDCES